MAEFETIDYQVKEGIGEIYISRPDVLNAFNNTVVEELVAALEQAHNSDSVYVIILSGKGRAFCAGVDTDELLGPARDRDMLYNQVRLTKVNEIMKLLYKGQKPTIAAINGLALGGGVSFALSCDMRIMDESAFLRDQHADLGIPPGAAEIYILPKIIGEAKAKEYMYTNKDIDADEALESGIVNQVTEEGKTMDVARELAIEVRNKPAEGIQRTKELFVSQFLSFEEAGDASNKHHWKCLQNPEHKIAIKAVRSGEEPDFDRDY